MMFARKLLAFFCLAAVLVAALSPVSAGLYWAILLPFLFVAGTAVVVWNERWLEENQLPTLLCLAVIASRAPPIAEPLS
jgi:hypothetical protein